MANKRLKKKLENKFASKQKQKSIYQVKRESKKLADALAERQRKAGKKITAYSLSYEELQKKEETYQKRKAYREKSLKKKKDYLVEHGIDLWDVSDAQIDKIKISDIENNKINEYTYPKIFNNEDMLKFDFNKSYKFKNGNKMLLAYKDYQGEQSLESLIQQYSQMNDSQLLDALKDIVNTPIMYGKRGDASSGSAGECIIKITTNKQSQSHLQKILYKNRKNTNKFDLFVMQHKGHKPVDYQILVDNKGRKTQDTYTPHDMLVLMNAVLHNITETNRIQTYATFYDDMLYHNEQFAKILPTPRY